MEIVDRNDASSSSSRDRVLNVTDLSQFVFCPRQFYLSKVLGLYRQPSQFVEGTLEHDARRVLNEALGPAYIECGPDSAKLLDAAKTVIAKVMDYAKNIALLKHPIFTGQIEEFVRELSFRILLEEKQRTQLLARTCTESLWADRVSASFPIENEFSVFSAELYLRGRIDEIYETVEGTLSIRDIKTAPVGFPFDEANQIQLGAYAMLLEEQETKAVVRATIYASRNLAERQVVIDDDLKKRVLDAGQNVRRFLANPELPEILTGPAMVKCSFCYLREECRELPRSVKDPRGIEALFNSKGKISLFGDD